MKIDELIIILEKAKSEGLIYCKIFDSVSDDFVFYANDINGYTYSFERDSIILLPDYI